MLKDMLGDCGEGVYIEAPFYANFGGHHCHFGKMVYANYHLTCVDDTHTYVGRLYHDWAECDDCHCRASDFASITRADISI